MSGQQNDMSHDLAVTQKSLEPDFEETIKVLHVDDDESFLEVAAAFLEREDDLFTILSETDVSEALTRFDTEAIECIVSDYDMPEIDGLEFLRQVRNHDSDLPFILYTGRGSEEIASEAISAGVTDYLQKGTGSDHYTLLAKRIKNAVSQYRAKQAVKSTQQRFKKLIEYSTDVISIVDADGRWQYLSPSAKRVLGYEPKELIGDIGFDYIHPEDQPNAMEKFTHAIEHPGEIPTVVFRFDHPDGWVWLENHARNMVDDPDIDGFVVHTRDVSDRVHREQELQRQNERMEEVMNAVSHDLRNPLHVARGNLKRAWEDGQEEHFEKSEQALDRVNQIIEDLLEFAREGEQVDDPELVPLNEVVADAWNVIETQTATLVCDSEWTLLADRSRLQRVFENLFHNAVTHGGKGVTVEVDHLDDGFYVEDDGSGIDADEVAEVFESGYSTSVDGTGFGLAIVNQIVTAHGWDISIADNATGTRFEIRGVTST